MRNNIANLQRELNLFIIEGNDYMADKMQKLIDSETRKQANENLQNLNEVVKPKSDENSTEINE